MLRKDQTGSGGGSREREWMISGWLSRLRRMDQDGSDKGRLEACAPSTRRAADREQPERRANACGSSHRSHGRLQRAHCVHVSSPSAFVALFSSISRVDRAACVVPPRLPWLVSLLSSAHLAAPPPWHPRDSSPPLIRRSTALHHSITTHMHSQCHWPVADGRHRGRCASAHTTTDSLLPDCGRSQWPPHDL